MTVKRRIENLERLMMPDETVIIISVTYDGMPNDWLEPHRDEVDQQIDQITKELGHRPKIVVVWPSEPYQGKTPRVTIMDDGRY